MAKKTAKKKPAAKKKAAPKKAAAKRVTKKSPPKKVARGVSSIPVGLHSVTPNLVINECAKAIAFYQEAFGAKLLHSMPSPDGRGVWHAAMQIGDSQIFLNDPMPGDPAKVGSMQLWVYGPDVDARFDRAVKAGAKSTMPLMDMFWGDRFGSVVDPFGQAWALAEHKRDMSMEEMRKGGEEFAKQAAQQSHQSQPPPPPPPDAEPASVGS